MSAETVDKMPPTDQLVLEVLAARYRTGERMWPFPSRIRNVLHRLEGVGLIGWKSGVVEHTCQAWLTEAGKRLVLATSYEIPVVAEAVARERARWVQMLADGIALNRGEIDLAEFRRRGRSEPSP